MTAVSSRERVELAGVWDKRFQQSIDEVREESAKSIWTKAMNGR